MASQPVTGGVAIAIDLGGTKIRAALVDRTGDILQRTEELTRASDGPEVVLGQIAALAKAVSAGRGLAGIVGAGVSSPGPLDTHEGLALGIPTLAGFQNYPLKQALAERLEMPVALENDGIAAAIGEWTFGAAKGYANAVYVTVSTGIGGGVIADGRVLRGRRGMAGHIGHMSFVRGGELCACGNYGCFEAYGSGTAFTRRAVAAGVADSAAAVFVAAAAGDGRAQQLADEEADILGQGFASLLHLYSPDVLVMGGGLSNQFKALRPGIMAGLRRSAMAPFRDTPVVPAALGNNSGLVGAATLVFELAKRPGLE
jgi:glucokinase